MSAEVSIAVEPTGPDPWFSKGPVAGQLASNNVSMLDSARQSVKSII